MILCRFNSKIKINNRVTRSRRVNARMETDDLPPSNLSHRKERETVKRVPNSRVFPDAGFALFEYRDLGY